jgi:hypothetical protein
MLVAFFIALVVAVAGIYWLVLKNASEKIARQYQLLSQSYDLELNIPEPAMAGFIRPEPSLYGHLNNREVSISVPGKGLQNTRQIETVLKLEISDKKFAAQLTGTGLLGSFRQRDSRGMERWKSGSDRFDSAVDVRTNDAATLERLLDEEARDSVAAVLKKGKGSIYIGSGVLAYAELGLIADDRRRERFESVLRLFLRFAEAL